MTPEELQAIRDRAEKARRGPWEVDMQVIPPNANGKAELGGDVRPLLVPRLQTAWEHPQYRGKVPIASLATTPYYQEMHFVHFDADDAAFIAHARQDIPRLIEEIERLRREQAEEVDEFNAGYKACMDGLSVDAEPSGLHHDVWRCGFAWADWGRRHA